MKIIGGSFGTAGTAFISGELLAVEAARKIDYPKEQIASIEFDRVSERKFGLLGAILGGLLLAVVLGIFLGAIGVVIALLLAVCGSFYKERSDVARIAFKDGATLVLECTPRTMKKLAQLKG